MRRPPPSVTLFGLNDERLANWVHAESNGPEVRIWEVTPLRCQNRISGAKILAALLGVAHPVDADMVSRYFLAQARCGKKGLRRKMGGEALLLLGSIQSGLVRHVGALGLEPFDLYRAHIGWRNGQRTRYFAVDLGFRFAAEEQGWPPKFLREAPET